MRKNKIDGYQLTGSIHTVEIKSFDTAIPDDEVRPYFNKLYESCDKDGVITSTAVINPNVGEDILSYSQLLVMLNAITTGAGIADYTIRRADMRFDSYDSNHYRRFAKLNRYLISALAVTYSVRNCYKTVDLFSSEQLSVAIKNRQFEAENYDKHAESNGTDAAWSRLEIRSKDGIEDIPTEFIKRWAERWKKAINNLDKVQARYNQELIRIYNRDKDAVPCRFRTVTDFVIAYQDCIFTRRQLINLLSLIPEIGSAKAERKADEIKRKYKLEYFSLAEIRAAVAEIERAAAAFFGS